MQTEKWLLLALITVNLVDKIVNMQCRTTVQKLLNRENAETKGEGRKAP